MDSNFVHDEVKHQFRLLIEGQIALVDYQVKEGVFYLVHSEVPMALRGKSVGKELVTKTFEYLESHQIKSVAVCSYIQALAKRSEKWRLVIG
jgi:uncharacterized protein